MRKMLNTLVNHQYCIFPANLVFIIYCYTFPFIKTFDRQIFLFVHLRFSTSEAVQDMLIIIK